MAKLMVWGKRVENWQFHENEALAVLTEQLDHSDGAAGDARLKPQLGFLRKQAAEGATEHGTVGGRGRRRELVPGR